MAITLTSDEYDEIRLLIGGDIDEDDLTRPAQINSDTVLGAAESFALRRISGGSTRLNAAETRAYRRAVRYRCAWILLHRHILQQIAETAGSVIVSASSEHRWRNDEKRFLQEQVDEEIFSG